MRNIKIAVLLPEIFCQSIINGEGVRKM